MSEVEQKSSRRIPVVSKRLKLLDEEGTQGTLIGVKCNTCGTSLVGLRRFCNCTSSDIKEVELSKEGTLYSYTIVRQSYSGWQGEVPYILGDVQLPEGPRVQAEVVDCPEEDIKIGMPMELILRVGGKDKEGNEVVVYKWRPKSS